MGMFDACTPNRSRQGSQQGLTSSFQGSGKQLASEKSTFGRGDTRQAAVPLRDFILLPWACAVVIILITTLSMGASLFWALAPSFLIIGGAISMGMEKYWRKDNQSAIFYCLCVIAGFSGLIVSLITYVHFLQPYHELGMGATYLDMLPSQSAMGATDATALVFAQGTSVDQARTYGFVDARNPNGDIYCVAPLSNKWTIREPGVQFFAAGINCCGKRSSFGCGQGGSGARGALILAREDNADPGFKAAVEGAAVQYGLQPGNGYLLLNMLQDPMAYRQAKLHSALWVLLIYVLVYLIIGCMTGYMAWNMSKK